MTTKQKFPLLASICLGFSISLLLSLVPMEIRAASLAVATPPTPVVTCPTGSDQSADFSLDGPGNNLIDIFQPQILEYLNSAGSVDKLQPALEGPFDFDGENLPAIAQVFSTDVSGDNVPDVVVDFGLLFGEENVDGALFIFSCQDGLYETLVAEPLNGYILTGDFAGHGVRAIRDMNANGIPEILIAQIWVVGTHVNFTRNVLIYEWDGNQLPNLVEGGSQSFPNTIEIQNGDFEISDTNADGTFELLAINALGRGPEVSILERAYTDIWAWDGVAFTLTCRRPTTAPQYRFQAVHDGDDAAQCQDYAAALAFYQQAIFDEQLLGWSEGRSSSPGYQPESAPTPDRDEGARLGAYARYRIMLLHALQGYVPEATTVYETLIEKLPSGSPGHEYAQMATAFWEEYIANGDFNLACDAAIAFATDNPEVILLPLGSAFYGWGRTYSPEDVCPLKPDSAQSDPYSARGYFHRYRFDSQI